MLVEPGEYVERLDVPAGVELISRVPDAAVLAAEPTAAPWVSVTAKAGPGALRGFKFQGTANGTIYIGVRLQGDGFEIDNTTFEGAIETAVEIQERAGSSVLRGNRFNVAGVPVRLGGAISPMLRRNQFFAPAEARTPAIEIGATATPRLEDNLFVRLRSAARAACAAISRCRATSSFPRRPGDDRDRVSARRLRRSAS